MLGTTESRDPAEVTVVQEFNKELEVIYVAHCGYELRQIPKAAGFLWDPSKRRWWTKIKSVADRIANVTAEDIQRIRDEEALSKAEQERALVESRAEDSDIDLIEPEGLHYFGYQRAGIGWALARQGSLIADDMGLGKAQPIDALVLTPSGWVEIGSLEVGDAVIGANGRACCVEGVFPQGVKPVYRVTTNDGGSTECCDEHLWLTNTALRRSRGYAGRVRPLKEIRESIADSQGNLNHFLPQLDAVHLASAEPTFLHHYLIGAILGDGGIRSRAVFSSVDDQVVDLVKSYLPAGVTLKKIPGKNCDYTMAGAGSSKPNAVIDHLRAVGLLGEGSKGKFIPEMYLMGSPKDRLRLLQGLMDTDGYVSPDGSTCQFSSDSPHLASGVEFIVRSLGGVARRSEKPAGRTSCGKVVDHPHFIVGINMPHGMCPFLLKRKAERWANRERKYLPARAIKSVEAVGEKECVCIRVSADDSLYITNDFIVTHNTQQGIGTINNDLSIQRVLITCPAFLRLMWRDKLLGRKDEFTDELPWLARPMKVQVIESSDDALDPRANIVICSLTMMKALHERLSKIKFDLHIVDEAHYCAKPSTDMTIYTYGGTTTYKAPGETKGHKIKVYGPRATRRLALTGTPMRGGPGDIFPTLHWLDPKAWPSYTLFAKRYVGKNNERNLPELQRILRSTLMIRRLKADVLKDLPPKLRQVIEFDAESSEVAAALAEDLQRFNANTARIAELAINKEFAKASEDPKDYAAAAQALNYSIRVGFEEMSKVRHEFAMAKIPFVIRHVSELMATGNKVVVFCHHKDVVEQIAAAFSGQSVFITGDTPMPKRREIELSFQGDAKIRLLVGNIDAAGVGLTLTESSSVVMAELDWTPSKVSQAEDRCHRYGQKDSVLVQHLVLTGSTDARMAHVMVEKQDRIDAALNTNTDPDVEMRIRASAGNMIAPIHGSSSEVGRTDIADMATSSFATTEAIALASADIDRVLAREDVSAIDRGVLVRLASVPTLSARQAALASVISAKYL
jgi:hypothetical protein